MTQRELVRDGAESAQAAAGQAARHPWVKTLARIGYAAIGVVYILVGVLALRIAAGPGGGETPDQQTALQQIQSAPLGQLILGLIALGLFGYMVWRLTEAIADLEGKGSDPKGLGTRASHALNGVIYGGIGLQAATMAIGRSSGGSGNGQQEWTARFMELPFGRWLVGLAGLFVIGYGLYQFYEAWKEKYRQRFAFGQMSATERRWIDPVSKAGLVAHGIVMGFVGAFLIQAALRFNPEEAQGLAGALSEVAQQPFGPWLLGAMAVGLVAYGIYKLAQGRYSSVLAR